MSLRGTICHCERSVAELRGMHKKIPHSELTKWGMNIEKDYINLMLSLLLQEPHPLFPQRQVLLEQLVLCKI